MSESSESQKSGSIQIRLAILGIIITIYFNLSGQDDTKRQLELQSRETNAVEEQVSVSKNLLKPFLKVETRALRNGHQITVLNVGGVVVVDGILVIAVEKEVSRGKEETKQLRAESELPTLMHSESMPVTFDQGWVEKWRTKGVSEVSGTLKVDCESKSKDPYSAKYSFRIRPIFDKEGRLTYQVISLKQITHENVRSVLRE